MFLSGFSPSIHHLSITLDHYLPGDGRNIFSISDGQGNMLSSFFLVCMSLNRPLGQIRTIPRMTQVSFRLKPLAAAIKDMIPQHKTKCSFIVFPYFFALNSCGSFTILKVYIFFPLFTISYFYLMMNMVPMLQRIGFAESLSLSFYF